MAAKTPVFNSGTLFGKASREMTPADWGSRAGEVGEGAKEEEEGGEGRRRGVGEGQRRGRERGKGRGLREGTKEEEGERGKDVGGRRGEHRGEGERTGVEVEDNDIKRKKRN